MMFDVARFTDLTSWTLETKRSKCWPSGCGVCGKLRFWSKIKLGKTLLIKTGRFRQPLALLVLYCLAASAISIHFSQNHIHFFPNYTKFCPKFDFSKQTQLQCLKTEAPVAAANILHWNVNYYLWRLLTSHIFVKRSNTSLVFQLYLSQAEI